MTRGNKGPRALGTVVGIMILARAVGLGAVYESTTPLIHGGPEAGHYVLVFTNKSLDQDAAAEVKVTVFERDSSRQFQFPARAVSIPRGQLNPVTGAFAKSGAIMVHLKLKDVPFAHLGRLITQVSTQESNQTLTWVLLILAGHDGKVLYTSDVRQFRAVP